MLVDFVSVKNPIAVGVDDRDLHSLSVEFGVVGRTKRLKSQLHGGVEGHVVLPVVLEELNHRVAAAADGAGVVGLVRTGRVGFVEVNAVVVNPADEQSRAEGTRTPVLGEGLLEVADLLHEHIHRNRCTVGDSVDLCFNSSTSDQLACVGHKPGGCNADVTVNFEHLFDRFGDDEAADDALSAVAEEAAREEAIETSEADSVAAEESAVEEAADDAADAEEASDDASDDADEDAVK